MSEILSLKTFKQQANEQCITKLRNLLLMAEQGEITGIAYAGIAPDGSVMYGATQTENFHHIIGAIERMKWELLYGEEKREGTT